MRRVAAEVGVSTMSLYRHVADKDDLLLQMMDTTLGEWPFPAQAPDGWRARLELAARMLWTAFRRPPWLAPALSVNRPQPVPNALPYIEWVRTALDGLGPTSADMLTTHITLFNYVRGTAANIELEMEAEATTGMNREEWLDTQESTLRSILDAGHFPLFERMETTDYTVDLDELFEFGLQRLLDGLVVLIASG
jgi:AcrR family transcriptional regulator